MNILIAGGTGFIGQFLTKRFLIEGHSVTVLGRSRNKIQKKFSEQVNALDWSSLKQHSAGTITHIDLIINLCGINITDKRWTDTRKQELINSRTEPTKILAEACAKLGSDSPELFNASAIGIYGINDPNTVMDESTNIQHNLKDFAQEIVTRWENALQPAVDANVRVIKMRFGVVLGKNGGALKKLLPIFKLGLGGKLGTGQQPFPWICIVDLFRAIEFCYKHKNINGAVNFVAPEIVTQDQLAKTIGEVIKRPTFMPTPAFVIKTAYGEMGETLLLNGQRVAPTVLEQHGFDFQYADLRSALEYATN